MRAIVYTTLLCLSAGIFSCQHQTNSENTKTINNSISVDEFEKRLSEGNVQLIDVRTSEEFDRGHLKEAINNNINSADFEQQLLKLDKSKPVLVYCLSGGRSSMAAEIMAGKGFKEVYNMQGGIIKWNAANKPIDIEMNPVEETGMTEDDFNKLLISDKYILVDYNAKWCKPCKKMAPMLDSYIDKRRKKIELVKIDADENRNLLNQKGIESLPVLELYKNGKLVWKHEGEIDETTLINEINL